MSEKNYILIGTENENATFVMKGDEIIFFEIFQLSHNVKEIEKSLIVINALNQQEALKKFRLNYPNLMKRSTKNYYETALIL